MIFENVKMQFSVMGRFRARVEYIQFVQYNKNHSWNDGKHGNPFHFIFVPQNKSYNVYSTNQKSLKCP